jgi:hypothetical protein
MTETIYKKDQKLKNALIATPLNPSTPTLSVQDIYLAVERKMRAFSDTNSDLPFSTRLHPIFSKHMFPTFQLNILQWTNQYRAQIT